MKDWLLVLGTSFSLTLVSYAVGWWRKALATRAERDRLVASADALTVSLEAMSALAKKEHDQRVQVVESIKVIENERNTWKEMYYTTGTGYGAAQDMLMREIERLSMLCQRAGVKNAAVSPAIRRVVSECAGKFAPPERSQNNGGITPGSPIEGPAKPV